MKLSKKLEKNIIKEALRIKSMYETPNAELNKVVAELKETAKNRTIQIIQKITETYEFNTREK